MRSRSVTIAAVPMLVLLSCIAVLGASPEPSAAPDIAIPPPAGAPLADGVLPPADARIAYIETATDELRLIDLANGEDILLASGAARGPVWSPDGSRVAYICGGVEGRVCVLDVVTGALSRLPGSTYQPAWSPDGTLLAYQRSDARGGQHTEVVSAAGGEPWRIEGWAARWSPRGDRLLVARSGPPDDMDWYVVAPDGSGARRLARAHNWGAYWSPDGTRVLLGRPAEGGMTLLTADPRGGRPAPLATLDHWLGMPAFWLDGDRLLVLTERRELYVLDPASGSVTSLSPVDLNIGASDGEPSLSPDGGWVAFAGTAGTTSSPPPGIYIAALTGGWARLPVEGTAAYPAWMPVASPATPSPGG